MFHNQEQQDAFEGEPAPSAYETYRTQHGAIGANWGVLEEMLWLALIGATEHVAQRQCTRPEYLQMMDRLMALAGQLPEPIYREFRVAWDDAFPALKGRY